MRCLVTGVTGTLGQMVTQMLITRGFRVIGYSRSEHKQAQMDTCGGRLTLYIGDVRDRDRLLEATRGVDLIFHFAAMKRVEVAEANPDECFSINFGGTANVLHCQRMHKIPRVVLASTDKAVYPVNIYGASKMCAERLVRQNENNVVCRYGNVLGSQGSVLPAFVESLSQDEPYVNITDRDMTRFWTTVERAASFVIASGLAEEGGLKIPAIGAARLLTVVSSLSEILDVPHYEIRDVGMRGKIEKLHECLEAQLESGRDLHSNEQEMTRDELRMLLEEALRGL